LPKDLATVGLKIMQSRRSNNSRKIGESQDLQQLADPRLAEEEMSIKRRPECVAGSGAKHLFPWNLLWISCWTEMWEAGRLIYFGPILQEQKLKSSLIF
jgi:hypothetical protein